LSPTYARFRGVDACSGVSVFRIQISELGIHLLLATRNPRLGSMAVGPALLRVAERHEK